MIVTQEGAFSYMRTDARKSIAARASISMASFALHPDKLGICAERFPTCLHIAKWP